MLPKWNRLDEPCDLNLVGYGKAPFPTDSGIELLDEEGGRTLIGDWLNVYSDEGCGCCAGGRYDKIVAWRDWRPLMAEEPK